MKPAVFFLSSVLLLALSAHCGPPREGFTVQGTLTLTEQDPAAGNTRNLLIFERETTIPNTSSATTYSGRCTVGPAGRVVRIDSPTAPGARLSTVEITLNDWEQDSCTNCTHGTITATIAGKRYSATEQRGSGTSTCTIAALRDGSLGMRLNVQCPELRADGESTTVSATGMLALQFCEAPSTTGGR